MKKKTSPCYLLVAVAAAMMVPSSHAAEIVKANNTTALDLTGSWVNGVVPGAGDIAVFTSNNTASSTPASVGSGVSFQGIKFDTNPGTNLSITAGAGALTLGSAGINLSAGNRTLTTNASIVLSEGQTWTTGSAAASTSQIVVNSIISGPGGLTINGTAGSPLSPVYLNALNTFAGGVTLNSGGAVRLSNTATYAGGLVTASAIGTGNFTINGGTVFGGSATLGASTTLVTGDFALNSGTSGINGRFTYGGGVLDLGGGTRTVSLGRFFTASGAASGGQESLRFLQSAGAPVMSIANGTLRLVRGETGSGADFVGVSFGTNSTFTAGTGLTIGQNVITTMTTGTPFGFTAGAQPILSVEAGGYFNMADFTNARSPQIRSLAGDGVVTNLSTNAGTQTATLTINPQSGDSTDFAGSIVNGSSLTATLGINATVSASTVAVTKTGAGTQILSGTNSYTGNTTVSAGTLLVNGNNSAATGIVNVTGAGTVLGGGGIVGGNTTLNAATRLRPIGDLDFVGSLTLVGSAAVDFAATADPLNPPLVSAGTLSLSSTWVLALGTGFENGGSTVIFEYTTPGTFAAGAFDTARIDTSGLGFTPSGPLSLSDTGTSVVLNGLAVIPEPSTWILIGLGIAVVFTLNRRRSARQ